MIYGTEIWLSKKCRRDERLEKNDENYRFLLLTLGMTSIECYESILNRTSDIYVLVIWIEYRKGPGLENGNNRFSILL